MRAPLIDRYVRHRPQQEAVALDTLEVGKEDYVARVFPGTAQVVEPEVQEAAQTGLRTDSSV